MKLETLGVRSYGSKREIIEAGQLVQAKSQENTEVAAVAKKGKEVIAHIISGRNIKNATLRQHATIEYRPTAPIIKSP